MRDDIVSFQLTGSVLEKVRVRAKQAGISEDQLVRDVLDEVLELGEARTIVALDCVEAEGVIVLDREDGEDDAAFQARSKRFADLFGPDRYWSGATTSGARSPSGSVQGPGRRRISCW